MEFLFVYLNFSKEKSLCKVYLQLSCEILVNGPLPQATADQLQTTAMAVGDLSSQRGAHLTTLNPAARRVQVSVLYARQYRPQKQNEGVHF